MTTTLPSKFVLVALSLGLFLTFGAVAYAQNDSATPVAGNEGEQTNKKKADNERPAGWHTASHSNDVEPNYAVVFPQSAVNTLTITISAENWAAMQADMTNLFGEPGTRRRGGFGGPRSGLTVTQPISPLNPPVGAGAPDNGRPPVGGPDFGGGPGFGGDFTPENPMWVTATLAFQGDVWTNVGIRYKGNSSLRSGWESKSLKLPFKLDFDEFEDTYPAIKNQRFYGFKQLSLANGFGDPSYMRDAISYDLLEQAGLVAAETAFYHLILDYGNGPVDLGLYTMVEVIDDTVIGRYFDDDSGNIYEGDGQGASLALGTLDQLEESFQKENNEEEADWSDLQALYTVLHDPLRTRNLAQWRTELEAVFDVDTFLNWLAISAVLQHWDTYGAMTHNFYLYHNPATDQLTWISWDHNLVLGGMGGGFGRPVAPGANPVGGVGGMRGPNRSVSFDKAEVTATWPLIRYLLDDPFYDAQYINALETASTKLFDTAVLTKQYKSWALLLAPYAAAESSQASFDASVQALIDRTNQRAEEVKLFLEKQP